MANISDMKAVLRRALVVQRAPEATLIMPHAPWMAEALKLKGQREIKGALHNPAIVALWQYVNFRPNDDDRPWCAAFVAASLQRAKAPSLRSARAADWANFGVPCGLRRGAIVVFGKADPDAGGSGHVAFIDRWNETSVWVLGGNQNNRVWIDPRPLVRIEAIRWPA